jgi:prevent-host-death family protein
MYTQLKEWAMETFSIRDLRERTGDLVRTAEAGQLSVVAKHGHPVFVAVPFDERLVANGVGIDLAVKLFEDGTVTLGRAAKLAGMCHEEFMDLLGTMAIPVVKYSAEEVDDEVNAFLT